ncbi:hypothetical protein RV10_GL004726 [Enterococcus pallens]|nr:hypothetical protein RV10_GL004726 [Enterococcus pallens]
MGLFPLFFFFSEKPVSLKKTIKNLQSAQKNPLSMIEMDSLRKNY